MNKHVKQNRKDYFCAILKENEHFRIVKCSEYAEISHHLIIFFFHENKL